MLAQSKLSLIMNESCLCQVETLGEVVSLVPNQVLFRKNDPAEYLYIVLDGRLVITAEDETSAETWVGPGDFIGAKAFIAGERQRQSVQVGSETCQVWRVHRQQFFRTRTAEQAQLITQLLVAITWHLQAEQQTSLTAPQNENDLIDNHCDHWHPAIQKLAAFLKGNDDWETAIATWHYIQQMPYRFGLWNMKASDTLALGYGMCTTKANLQVALLRANGIKAGIGKIEIPSHLVKCLMPKGYGSSISPTIKHFFAAMKLDGRWYPCDATFTDESLALLADVAPEFGQFIGVAPERGQPYNPDNTVMDLDPFEFELLPNLSKLINKKPFYSQRNVDAMNVCLDKAQGPIRQSPLWLKAVKPQAQAKGLSRFQTAFQWVSNQLEALQIS